MPSLACQFRMLPSGMVTDEFIYYPVIVDCYEAVAGIMNNNTCIIIGISFKSGWAEF